MFKLSNKEAKALWAIVGAFCFLVLILLLIMNISLFFVALIVMVAALCLIKIYRPQWLEAFKKTPKPEETPAPPSGEKPGQPFSAKLVLLYSGSQIQVNRPDFLIGRSRDCDFVLSGNDSISKRHAIIRYDENKGQSTLIDRGSKNGTKLNGQMLLPDCPYPLKPGDVIQIEDRLLTVRQKSA